MISLTFSRFATSKPGGPAYGRQVTTTWEDFTRLFQRRREGVKDGPCFIPATFTLEPGGRVRRLRQT